MRGIPGTAHAPIETTPTEATPVENRVLSLIDESELVELTRALIDAGGENPGGSTMFTGWTAACDGGFISRDLGIPAIVLGPGGLADQAHRPDESVSITDLATAARAYALLALRML